MNEYLSDSTVRLIIGVTAILAVEYVCVLGAVLADLRSGILKARRNGVRRTSRGYRRTVEKLGRYYIMLMAMTFVDVMIIVASLYLKSVAGWNVPPFPWFSTIGAIGLSVIELKSICETSDEKGDYSELLKLLKRLMRDADLRDLLKR